MAAPLLYTKLYQPVPRPGVTPRPRLLLRIEETLSPGIRLGLVSAPAGYGKTTLVAGWLAALQARPEHPLVTWLSLDEGDNDPARFLGYLIAALRKLQPEIGAGVLSLLSLPQLPALDGLLGELINELGTIEQPFLLVLDDFHLLHNPELAAGMEFFLERMPPHARLVITTREDPPLPLSRMRVRGELLELRTADLRFTVDEAGAFFQETLGLALGEAALAQLDTRTEGWIAGLQLAALALRQNSADPEALQSFLDDFSGSHRYVIDYLVDEVLAHQPENVRSFLLRTSILSRFSAELCAALVDDPTAPSGDASLPSAALAAADPASARACQALLETLERSNLFLVPLDPERRWYRYHRLFSDVLRAGLDAECEAILHCRAAEWWEQHGDIEEAIRHRLAGGDHAGAGALIASHAIDFVRRGRLVTLMGWINQIPSATLLASPDLPIFKTLGLMLTGQLTEAVDLCTRTAPHEPQTGADSPAARLARGRRKALEAWFGILRSDPRSLELAEEAIALLGDMDPFFHVMVRLPLGSMLAVARNDYLGSTRVFNEAFEIGLRTDNLFGALGALANLLFNLLELGQYQRAKQLCQRIFNQYVDSRGRPLPQQGLIYIPYSVIMLYEHNLEEAQRYARRGLELCQMLFSSLIMGGDGEMVLAQVAFWRGEHERAFAILDEIRETARQRSLTNFVQRTEIMMAHLRLRLGDLAVVQRWADENGLRDPARLASAGIAARHIYARLLMAEGRGEEACALLAELERSAAAEQREGGRMLLLIRLAIFESELGKRDSAARHMREALRIAAANNARHFFIREGQNIAPLLRAARSEAPSFVDGLLSSIANDPVLGQAAQPGKPGQPAAPKSPAPLPEPLSEQELNVIRLLGEGKSNQEIADELYISVGTAKWHVHNILGKLDVTSRTQAIAKARELSLI